MARLLRILVLGFLFFQEISATSPRKATDIAYFTELSRQLLVDPNLKPEQEKERADYIHHSIVDEVPDYGTDSSLEKIIVRFVNDVLKANFKVKQIIDSKKTPWFGLSQAKVYFIYNRDQSLQYVIKAFPSAEKMGNSFLCEILGMALIKERGLENVTTAKPLAIGKCRFEEKSYGLLLQKPSSGQRVDWFIEAIRKFPPGDPERKERLKLARQMCAAVGAGLAEFHGVSRDQSRILSQDGFLNIKLKFNHLFSPKTKEKLSGKINVSTLKKYVDNKITSIVAAKPNRLYCHGDASLRNIFYDKKKNRITLIDVARIPHRVSKTGQPLSHSLYDLFHFQQRLCDLAAKRKLAKEEIDSLLDALSLGYLSWQCDAKEAQPSGLYTAVNDICKYCRKPSFDSEKMRMKEQLLFSKRLDYVKQILSE